MENNQSNWDIVIDSPGRINIIGEHVDYNDGFVLPTAIDKKIQFKIRKNQQETACHFYSKDFNKEFRFDLASIAISQENWQNYILGVVHEIQELGKELKGFDCEISGNIPVGSGVSSSAALECGLAFALNELFELQLDKLTIVKLSQRAEHNYVGTQCGIMDQFASVMSKKDHVILLDCENLDFNYIPIQIEPYTLLLLNTNVTHELSNGEYNIRRAQCEKGVQIINTKYPQVKSLRGVQAEILEEFKEAMDPIVYQRCKYVLDENDRVLKSVEALKNNQLNILGNNLYKTHEGLSKMYEVSCEELDFLVDFSRDKEYILGARMMGGGFGGCTINLIQKDKVDEFTKQASASYENKFGIKLQAFEAIPSAGTTKIVSQFS